MKSFLKSMVMVFLLSCSLVGFSQSNSHYWSHQYGSKGLLLNGAVVASADDETAIFYNPGAMGMNNNTGISLSLVTPTFSHKRTIDLIGSNTSINDTNLGLSPGLVAGMFKPFKSKKIIVGVCTFTRYQTKSDFKERVLGEVADDPSSFFLGEVRYDRRMSERWLGLGVAYRLHPKLSVGITNFATFHSEHLDFAFKKEILNIDSPDELLYSWRSDTRYGFSTYGGMISKVGINWKPYHIKFGLTFTTDTWHIFHSDAAYEYDDQKVYPVESDHSISNIVSTDLDNFKSPWSLGGGVELPMGNSNLSISMEYFSKISSYNIIYDERDPYGSYDNGDVLVVTDIKQSNERVLNFAIGIERNANRKFKYYYGFRTDFSPIQLLDLGEGVTYLGNSPDMFHFSLGTAYSYKRSHYSIGLDYGVGHLLGGPQLLDINNISADNLFTINTDPISETYVHSFNLFITYDF